ncbi:MAG: UvrD-helicase domain-containing protein [Bacteroidales bacterium]|nr:UvrD-helicase domain-containing protein [Bacteroidales bacterium]
MNNTGREEILRGLNEAQREAVESIEGPLLIVAGAGSGKTRVLTCRIANLIDKGVEPWRILALTFTKKAAGEMKSRISSLVGERSAGRIWMGTFHSVFVRFLREYADLLGYPRQFTIYDAADTKSAITKCIKELNLDDKTYKPSAVAAQISRAKNDLLTAAAYSVNAIYQADDKAARRPRLHEVYSLYAAKCKASGAMDFDDILLNTNILFRDHKEALEATRNRFKYILVDEYQDTNYAQYLILKKLAAVHHNICVVGDDSQSIYSFRGARIENILSFQKDYPESRIIRLEQNYRSTQTIVDAANSLIDKNKNRIKKVCYSKSATGAKIHVINAASDFEEGHAIAAAIKRILWREKAEYSDFAILYRTNAQSRVLEESLRKQNLPCRVVSGTSFFDRAEVKDMVAYFRLVINPQDNEAFRRIINLPARGIGATSLAALDVAASNAKVSLLQATVLPEADLLAAGLKTGAIAKFREFYNMIMPMAAKAAVTDAYTLASEIGLKSGMMAYLQFQQDKEGKDRLENVQELFNGIKQYLEDEAEEGKYYDPETGEDMASPDDIITISDYIENFTLLSSAEKTDDNIDDDNRISLMTVHSSKGLEFPFVFVAGLEENLFPSGSDLLPADIEEERRLFYVAITRAEKEVSLSYASMRHRYGKEEFNQVSRFITEIDGRYLDGDVPQRSAFDDFGRAANSGFGWGRTSGETSTGKWAPNYGRPQAPQRPQPSSRPQPYSKPAAPVRPIPKAPAVRRPAPADFKPDRPEDIRAGMRVEHNIFGPGIIQSVEGTGGDAKAIFVTDGGETKKLILKYAKLRICR